MVSVAAEASTAPPPFFAVQFLKVLPEMDALLPVPWPPRCSAPPSFRVETQSSK